jgi:uroporphyrinogen-III synthase
MSNIKIAAIGPTTAAAVLQCIGRPADAIAAQPSAAALREAIDSVLRT